jgi:hypothetical protein
MVALRSAQHATAYQIGSQRFAAVATIWDSISAWSRSIRAETKADHVSQELTEHYTSRLLLLVELEGNGGVKAAEVVGAEPFVYDRTEIQATEPDERVMEQ